MSSSDQSLQDGRPHCKRNARNQSEKKRRDQFNVLILELCSMVSATRSSKMDKSTILKATINFLKQHNEMANRADGNTIKENWKPSFLSDDEFSQLMLEALDGFVIVYSQQGHILYASESIVSLLRHLPKELQSSTIYELIHEDDRPEIFKILMEADSGNGDLDHLREKRYSFTCRMRKGSLEPEKQVQYETVRFSGNFSFFQSNPDSLPEGEQGSRCCFIATACLQNTQLIREMTSSAEKEKEFSSRHSLDWKFLFLDHRGPPVLGYLPFEVLGTSVYEYYHQDDLEKLTECHEALMQTGEGLSCYYRYLSKGQEWIWLQTRYYITYNQWNSKPEFIVCTHRVVSYAEVRKGFNRDMLLSDDASMSDSFASNWNVANSECMSEMSFSLRSSSSDEQSNPSRRGIMSEKIYKPSKKWGRVSNSKSQPGYPERSEVSDAASVATLSVSRVPDNVNLHHQPTMSPLVQSPMNGEHGPGGSQLSLIQVKLQKQLMTRHQKLQEDIMRQQQELQNVQQQLLRAQELIFRQSPFLGGGLAPEQGRLEAPSTPGGNWSSNHAVQDLPSATEARSMNLPLHHRFVHILVCSILVGWFREFVLLGGRLALGAQHREQGGWRPPPPCGNWNSNPAVRDLPSATVARRINLPLHHSDSLSVRHQPPSSSSTSGAEMLSYPAVYSSQPSHPQVHYHMVHSPTTASPLSDGDPRPSTSEATHQGIEERLAFPGIISNLRNNQNQGPPSHLLRFDPSQNSVVAMSPGQSQPSSLGADYSHPMLGGHHDQEIGGFLNSGSDFCDDLELDPSMIPGFMD